METQHPKGCCVELGNWPIKVQLGSTNSKGLPALVQGSRQGFLLNNQLIHHDESNGHAHCHPFACLQPNPTRCEATPPSSSQQPSSSNVPPSMPATLLHATVIHPECPSINRCVASIHSPKKSRLSSSNSWSQVNSEVNHLVDVSILSTKKHRLRECPNTHGWVPPSTCKGPCAGVEAERRIKPMVLPRIDGSLILEFQRLDFAPTADG